MADSATLRKPSMSLSVSDLIESSSSGTLSKHSEPHGNIQEPPHNSDNADDASTKEKTSDRSYPASHDEPIPSDGPLSSSSQPESAADPAKSKLAVLDINVAADDSPESNAVIIDDEKLSGVRTPERLLPEEDYSFLATPLRPRVNREKISEFSEQLKQRLTYAMVKVEHGWTRQSIQDIEPLVGSNSSTSAASSTTLPNTGFTGPYDRVPSTNSTQSLSPHKHRVSLASRLKAYRKPRSLHRRASSETDIGQRAGFHAYTNPYPLPPPISMSISTDSHSNDASRSGVAEKLEVDTSPVQSRTDDEDDAIQSLMILSSPRSKRKHSP
ncbi:hypothetical protein CANCADRAFT_132315 [Tortispora caseinolytica NRRL Y-17796]|uniref:Uncharacterized protein n=1 Tax=Tortispora caseinolytica NRRL Y-17796 TaxID=767744 RepID=A0A1E4TB18_9ASCO|nr:hypothetical protein CANCADRAFT_132315 [Tortispora caseinolytica NRRL Y-17796]